MIPCSQALIENDCVTPYCEWVIDECVEDEPEQGILNNGIPCEIYQDCPAGFGDIGSPEASRPSHPESVRKALTTSTLTLCFLLRAFSSCSNNTSLWQSTIIFLPL